MNRSSENVIRFLINYPLQLITHSCLDLRFVCYFVYSITNIYIYIYIMCVCVCVYIHAYAEPVASPAPVYRS